MEDDAGIETPTAAEPAPGHTPGLITRRRFLTAAGAGGAAYVAVHQIGLRGLFDLGGERAGSAVNLTYETIMRRRDDQLTLQLSFYNIVPDFTQNPPVLKQANSNTNLCYYVVSFAPQNLAEQAFMIQSPPNFPSEGDSANPDPSHTDTPLPAGQVGSLLAGQSRLAFVVPTSLLAPNTNTPLQFDSNTLLDWVLFEMSVAQNAQPLHPILNLTPRHKPLSPTVTQTAIELPWRVQLSPSNFAGWAHSAAAVDHGTGRFELWHTRLGTRKQGSLPGPGGIIDLNGHHVDEHDPYERGVRAIWALDPNFAHNLQTDTTPVVDDSNPLPFRMSLNERDRYDIVRLSSDWSLYRPLSRIGTRSFVPLGEEVNQLILSPLGGWLDSDAHWDLETRQEEKYNSSLLQWRHKSAMLRDDYVRVVRKGYLFPFGHKASLIKVTERKFNHANGDDSQPRGAYLRQRIFIVVANPFKEYDTSPYVPLSARKFPFTSVEATTLVTPNLDVPTPFLGDGDSEIFEPYVGGDPFLFHFQGTDWDGAETDFRSRVLWVDDTQAYSDAKADEIIDAWAAMNVQVGLKGNRITVAPHSKPGDTRLVLDNIELHGHKANTTATFDELSAASQPNFYPTAFRLQVHLSEVTTASGHAVSPPNLAYHQTYLDNGFTSPVNKGSVFLMRPDTELQSGITFDPDKAGGAMTPNLAIDGMSRSLGPVSGDIDQLTLGNFDPQTVFSNADAKLLGGIHLKDILGFVSFADDDTTKAMEIQTVELPSPDRIVTTIDWHPDLKPGGPIPDFNIFIPNNLDSNGVEADACDLHAEVITYTDPALQSKSTFSILGELRDFTMKLFGESGDTHFMDIPFNRLTFRAEKNKKTDVQVDIGDVVFVGALEFVQELAEFLSFGDGNGLTIDTSGDSIQIQLTLALPSLGVGIFSLENLAISAGCGIPYNGDPVRFEFAFCSAENPFHLIVMMFGGGGFVGLSIGVDGVEILEFSFEFGAGISIDVGIASGSIEIMGGVYFKITTEHTPTGDAQLLDITIYIDFKGEVEALGGIASVSIELYMALTYESGPDGAVLSGDAVLTVEVHVLIFSGSASVSVHRELSASGGSGFAVPNGRARPFNQESPALDPGQVNFADIITDQITWASYCDAFAPVGG